MALSTGLLVMVPVNSSHYQNNQQFTPAQANSKPSLKLELVPPSKSFFSNLHAFFPWGASDSILLLHPTNGALLVLPIFGDLGFDLF